jgi:SET domain-containing protein
MKKNICKVVVKNSNIHGRGVFASKDIKKGERVIEYVGRKVSKEESDKVFEETIELAKGNETLGEVYLFELNDEYDVDGNVEENDARFINHSCMPNCETEIEDDRIWVVAKKSIKKGEEILYNYGFEYDVHEDYPCKCGAENCIGYIVDEEHWDKIKNKK